jgi:hypothetical protein
MGYNVAVIQKNEKEISLKVAISHPDYNSIGSGSYDLEQFCLKFLVDSYRQLAVENHSLKAKYDKWSTLAYGAEINLEGEEVAKWTDEKYYVGHKRIGARRTESSEDGNTITTLCLEPEYRFFCFAAQDHISNIEIIDKGDFEIINFKVKEVGMLEHLDDTKTWESNAYDYWSCWIEVYHRLKAADITPPDYMAYMDYMK